MTVITFPTCLPAALAELLVPALTEAQVAGERRRYGQTVEGLIKKTFLALPGAGAFFFVSADMLSGYCITAAGSAPFMCARSPPWCR
jgi:O-antigen/teichoic acid export membrane protein